MSVLETELCKLSVESLVSCRPNLNALFSECVDTLASEHHIKVSASLPEFKP